MSARVVSKVVASIQAMIPEIIFVLGAPGSGKGTQCKNVAKEYGFVHLSTGELLREEIKRPGSEFGEMIEGIIVSGQIVPAEVMCSLVEQAMKKSGKSKFLIDGYPRDQVNLDQWTKTMSEKTKLLFVLFFECSKEDCIKRCLRRGASGSGRSDDNLVTIKKRFDTYINQSLPIIKHFENLKLVKIIDGSAENNQVFINVKKVFNDAGVSK